MKGAAEKNEKEKKKKRKKIADHAYQG